MQIQKNNNRNLVTTIRQKVRTDSLIVADKFGKRHDNVIQKIENLVEMDDSNRLDFKVVEYKDSKGEFRKSYTMDRKSFAILAMGFTGKLAFEWKLKFLTAFESMEQILLRQQNFEWQDGRLKGKTRRLELTDSIQKVVELAREHGSKNADRYYTSITKLIYGQVFNLKRIPDNFRNMLDETALKKLRLIEEHTALWLDESVRGATDYHLPYQALKPKLTALIDVMGGISLNLP